MKKKSKRGKKIGTWLCISIKQIPTLVAKIHPVEKSMAIFNNIRIVWKAFVQTINERQCGEGQ